MTVKQIEEKADLFLKQDYKMLGKYMDDIICYSMGMVEMKGHFVVGAYDGKNFSGTEYDSKNNELGQVSYNKEEFSENIQRFHIVRGEE